jgi:hypothetical protein
MSDYLSRITERASSAPTTVRPALPSLFEPVKTAGALAAVSTAPGTEPMLGTEHDLQPASEAGEKSRSIHDCVASLQSIWTAPVISATPPKSEAATKQTSADLVRMPVVERATRVFAAESPAAVEPSGESPHQQPVVWPRTANPRESTQRQPIVEDAKPPSRPLVSAKPTPATGRIAQGLATAAPLLISAVARTPIASRERAPAETAFVTDADSSPALTIHVTIGRVEVRAIMPPAQVTQPPARPAPKMSLDDYLRSRNGSAA